MKNQLIRHGDLALKLINSLPADLTETKTKVLITGSHGNHHTIDKGKVYFKKVDDFVFGYLFAKKTTLDHPEHGKVKLTDGVYELRKQNEIRHDGLKPVID